MKRNLPSDRRIPLGRISTETRGGVFGAIETDGLYRPNGGLSDR